MREVVSQLDQEGIASLLAEHGITLQTPKPDYLPPIIDPTAHCVAWRQTGGCDPKGEREKMLDEHCATTIIPGRSGYCECADGRPPVEFACEHTSIVCEEECTKDPVPAEDVEEKSEGTPDEEF